MGDLISTTGEAAGALVAAPGPEAAAGACATTTCGPPAFVPCPARETRTDDHAPNGPRRTSIAPSSGASLRICTSCAMMSRFMAPSPGASGPKLHELHELRQAVRQERGAPGRQMHVVLDAHTTLAPDID